MRKKPRKISWNFFWIRRYRNRCLISWTCYRTRFSLSQHAESRRGFGYRTGSVANQILHRHWGWSWIQYHRKVRKAILLFVSQALFKKVKSFLVISKMMEMILHLKAQRTQVFCCINSCLNCDQHSISNFIDIIYIKQALQNGQISPCLFQVHRKVWKSGGPVVMW